MIEKEISESLDIDHDEFYSIKKSLASYISEIIKDRKLTQAQARHILGIDQPKISALIRGRLRSFSLERLIRFLNILGQDVFITITPSEFSPGKLRTFINDR